jgi:hypothetical protein
MNELEDHILEFLGVYWDVDTYGNDCVFSYENQVPMKGIYLKKGKIQLLKRNKVVKELTEPGPYFIEELLYMNPYKTPSEDSGRLGSHSYRQNSTT